MRDQFVLASMGQHRRASRVGVVSIQHALGLLAQGRGITETTPALYSEY